jgi:hypothetical protein
LFLRTGLKLAIVSSQFASSLNGQFISGPLRNKRVMARKRRTIRWQRVALLLVLCVVVMGGAGRRSIGQGRATAAEPQSSRSEEVKRLEQQFDQMFSESRLDEALAVAQRALAIVEIELGPEHSDVVPYLLRVASVYTMKGDAAHARRSQVGGAVPWAQESTEP